jgi:hypothetical protein
VLECVQEWQRTSLPDMRRRFGLEPYNQPLVFLSVSNITLFGSPEDYATQVSAERASLHPTHEPDPQTHRHLPFPLSIPSALQPLRHEHKSP